ncbi:MAG TPA: hypothetical protein VHC97_05540 [Thermoanaerobaculia bacterium]|nr:hypothetical protein [Thermoanaerobaculia bacterium]
MRDWLDEPYGYRLENAALALEALCRPRQAQTLWRHLATSNSVYAGNDLRQRAREALERLER